MIKKNVLAIITARGGSKGVPRKNVRALGGEPLIIYSIEAAKNCPFVNRVVVTTDDQEIRKICLKAGTEVVDRPKELATSSASSESAVLHALQVLGAKGGLEDHIVLLQPTSPLRSASHLTDCLEKYFKANSQCSISVCENEHHPYKSFLLGDDDSLIPLRHEKDLCQPRQMLPKTLRQNGAIYAVTVKLFLEKQTFFIPPVLPYLMEIKDSVDIDTELDFKVCEILLQEKSFKR